MSGVSGSRPPPSSSSSAHPLVSSEVVMFLLYVDQIKLLEHFPLLTWHCVCRWYVDSAHEVSREFTFERDIVELGFCSFLVIPVKRLPTGKILSRKVSLTLSFANGEHIAVAFLDLKDFGCTEKFKRCTVELKNQAGVFAVVQLYSASQKRWEGSPVQRPPDPSKGAFVSPERDAQADYLFQHITGGGGPPPPGAAETRAGTEARDQVQRTDHDEPSISGPGERRTGRPMPVGRRNNKKDAPVRGTSQASPASAAAAGAGVPSAAGGGRDDRRISMSSADQLLSEILREEAVASAAAAAGGGSHSSDQPMSAPAGASGADGPSGATAAPPPQHADDEAAGGSIEQKKQEEHRPAAASERSGEPSAPPSVSEDPLSLIDKLLQGEAIHIEGSPASSHRNTGDDDLHHTVQAPDHRMAGQQGGRGGGAGDGEGGEEGAAVDEQRGERYLIQRLSLDSEGMGLRLREEEIHAQAPVPPTQPEPTTKPPLQPSQQPLPLAVHPPSTHETAVAPPPSYPAYPYSPALVSAAPLVAITPPSPSAPLSHPVQPYRSITDVRAVPVVPLSTQFQQQQQQQQQQQDRIFKVVERPVGPADRQRVREEGGGVHRAVTAPPAPRPSAKEEHPTDFASITSSRYWAHVPLQLSLQPKGQEEGNMQKVRITGSIPPRKDDAPTERRDVSEGKGGLGEDGVGGGAAGGEEGDRRGEVMNLNLDSEDEHELEFVDPFADGEDMRKWLRSNEAVGQRAVADDRQPKETALDKDDDYLPARIKAIMRLREASRESLEAAQQQPLGKLKGQGPAPAMLQQHPTAKGLAVRDAFLSRAVDDRWGSRDRHLAELLMRINESRQKLKNEWRLLAGPTACHGRKGAADVTRPPRDALGCVLDTLDVADKVCWQMCVDLLAYGEAHDVDLAEFLTAGMDDSGNLTGEMPAFFPLAHLEMLAALKEEFAALDQSLAPDTHPQGHQERTDQPTTQHHEDAPRPRSLSPASRSRDASPPSPLPILAPPSPPSQHRRAKPRPPISPDADAEIHHVPHVREPPRADRPRSSSKAAPAPLAQEAAPPCIGGGGGQGKGQRHSGRGEEDGGRGGVSPSPRSPTSPGAKYRAIMDKLDHRAAKGTSHAHRSKRRDNKERPLESGGPFAYTSMDEGPLSDSDTDPPAAHATSDTFAAKLKEMRAHKGTRRGGLGRHVPSPDRAAVVERQRERERRGLPGGGGRIRGKGYLPCGKTQENLV
ncbi:unnamed protein product [Vitrella brassicaformis CCMP3155]|uniref:Uncharacterized protein n=2 Tax=Vitrella brassicaformis TaxID=1169539 RepID=A0A0G4ETH5_VITBC|nr:unnamed protein product [Vitrella brassicaformis CCMP3155]|eukprot:CEM00959.1 unnamed protein product [Vitrella brassicaformis CCMP3155]